MEVFILVDYRNIAKLFLGNRDPSSRRDHQLVVDKIVGIIIDEPRLGTYSSYQIRLYSAWYLETPDEATDERSILGVITDTYPSRQGRARVRLRVADGTIGSAHTFRGTLRDRSPNNLGLWGLSCRHNQPCPNSALSDWISKRRCPAHPTCRAELGDVIRVRQQKLVDSMIVVDAMHLSHVEGRAVAILSNDDDVVPAIVSLREAGREAYLLAYGRRKPSIYNRMLVDLDALLEIP